MYNHCDVVSDDQKKGGTIPQANMGIANDYGYNGLMELH
jgi:hypothetical protein